jgi:CheY-like chemotaxis protein
MVDGKMIRQVVLNLFSNAVRSTEAGFVRLRCEVSDGGDDDGGNRGDCGGDGSDGSGGEGLGTGMLSVLIEVSDSGPGLPPERLDSLTQRYGHSVGGTGVGLHLVNQLLVCMGSELCAESPCPHRAEAREGARTQRGGPGSSLSFVLRLERASVEAVDGAEAEEGTALPAQLRVLIVDDVRLNRILLKHALASISPGWDVSEAASAEEALTLVRGGDRPPLSPESFGLIIFDEQFDPSVHGAETVPMRGSEAIRLIREHEVATRAPRATIVSCTGHASHGLGSVMAYFYECGSDAVWGKPYPNHRDGEMQAVLKSLLKS